VELARHGVYIGLDSIQSKNPAAVKARVDMVTSLIAAGYLERILISHDVCMPSHMTTNGGNGFGFILGGFKQELLTAGVSEEEFDVITRANPARLAAY
jgi:predicted metal-dependent phosphotriesterase family hydrolase